VESSSEGNQQVVFDLKTPCGRANGFLSDLFQEVSLDFSPQTDLFSVLLDVDSMQFLEWAIHEQFFRLANNILMAGTDHDTIPFLPLLACQPCHNSILSK
jgi:hypothetical protein